MWQDLVNKAKEDTEKYGRNNNWTMKDKHSYITGKKVAFKGKIPGYYHTCKICAKKAQEHENWAEELIKLGESINEDKKIEKIELHEYPWTNWEGMLSRPQILIIDKLNELVEVVNELKKK